jgi:hypothetical protein
MDTFAQMKWCLVLLTLSTSPAWALVQSQPESLAQTCGYGNSMHSALKQLCDFLSSDYRTPISSFYDRNKGAWLLDVADTSKLKDEDGGVFEVNVKENWDSNLGQNTYSACAGL